MDDHEPAAHAPSHASRAKLFRPDGRVENTISLMVMTEAEAVDKAHALASFYDVELWDRDRKVALVPLRRR